MPELTQPLKYHGGKTYLASWIISHMPKHFVTYAEPYAGGLAVLLARNPVGTSEVVNDVNLGLTTFWRVLQDDLLFAAFKRFIDAVPFSQIEWEKADEYLERHTAMPSDAPVEYAVNFFIRCRQSLAGRCKSFAPMSKTRTRRGMNEQASAWLGAVEGLADVHARLKRVAIYSTDALEFISSMDGPQTLFYCDPPYLPQTRTAPDVYEHEMTYEQHEKMLVHLRACRGKVMLSGYPNELYDKLLIRWRKVDKELPNNAAGGKEKRRMVERLWMNWVQGF